MSCWHWTMGPNSGPHCFATTYFQDTTWSKIGYIGNALNNLKLILNINSQKYPVYSKYFHPRSKCLFYSTSSRFLRYKVENQKIGNALNDLGLTLNSQNTLYTVRADHRGTNFRCFSLWLAIFKTQGCWKLEMHQITSDWIRTLTDSSLPHILQVLNPEAQMLVPFVSWPAVFQIQGCWNYKCTEWPQNDHKHLNIKSTLYTYTE